MASKIITSLSGKYGEFDNVLPEELTDSFVDDELKSCRLILNEIIKEDLESIKQLLNTKGVLVPFDEFSESEYIIKKAFELEKDPPYQSVEDEIQFFLAQWWIRKDTLGMLAEMLTDELQKIRYNYNKYSNPNIELQNKRVFFLNWIRHHQNFIGYIMGISRIITDYSDSFELLSQKIDPSYQKSLYYAAISDISDDELLSATLELLLRGNFGRLAGFPLIRSAIEVSMTRRILDIRRSTRFKGKEIKFMKSIPTVKTICKIMEDNGMAQIFKTDSIRRLYDWMSIISHRGYRVQDAMLWFVLFFTNYEILPNLDDKKIVSHNIDIILDELKKKKQIDIV